MLYAIQCDTPAPYWPSTSYIRIAKLFVPAGAFVHASCGDTFWPGHGQISLEPGLQGRFGSSAAKRAGMRAPSAIDVDVSVKKDAASDCGIIPISATLTNAAAAVPGVTDSPPV
jgi:hypothetical protein